ncbi:MAG: glycoside hydrolase family 10 protein, partial [Microcystaceae cyanobacterium]
MAKAGINTVFFETVNAGYPIYPSRVAPEQNPLTLGWDPLKAAVNLAHERKMELHAWVWTFAAANQRHNLLLNQPLDYLGPVLSQHPDWAITDKAGNPFDHTAQYKKAFLDPANPEVRRYLLALLDEIATNYDVDGIQLDYIRYPFQDLSANQTFGYSNSSRWLFKQITGVDPIDISPGHPLWDEWTGFRIRQVDSFVEEASGRLKQERPNLILSVAVFPIPQRERLFRLQQNWEEWGKQGWVNMIVLMTYALDTGNLADMTRPLFEQSVAGSTILLPGLRLLKVPDPVTVDQMQFLRNMPTGGYALFAAENLTPDLQMIFGRTQGSRQSTQTEPLPYRQPFKATAVRYQALQREWSFLVTKHQLIMDEATLKNWGKQVDALGDVLNQLAENPSSHNFTSAQAALTSFRRQFATWMRQHKATHPYQVQVWENRLETLDRLMSYGDRTVLNQGQGSVAGKSEFGIRK